MNRGTLSRAWSQYPIMMPAFLLFAASVLVRIVYLNQIESLPTFYFPIMDEAYHLSLVDRIATTGYGAEPFFRAPVYPYLLAAITAVTGNSLYWARLVQVVMGGIIPLLIFLLGIKIFSRRVALWAGAVAVLYPTFLYYDASLLITSPMVLLTLLLLVQLYRTEENPSYLQFIFCGLLLGLAGISRPNILLLGPILFFWIWLVLKPRMGWKRAIISYGLTGLISLVVILPVTLRNYVVSDDFVFIAWQGGYNFYLGNNRQASGWSATVAGIDATWEGSYRQSISFAERSESRQLRKSEVSDFWYDLAWSEIGADPGHFVALALKKVRLLINGYEIPNNQNIYLAREYSPLIAPLMFNQPIYFPFGLLAPLALVGLVLSLRHWRKYFLLYLFSGAWTLSLLLFFVCTRFRQPLLPVMILLAVYAIARLIDMLRKRDFKNSALTIFALLLLGVESNHDILHLSPERVKAEDHLLIGNSWLEQNQIGKARQEFSQAVRADSEFADAHNNLGMIDARRGNLQAAISSFSRAIDLDPMNVDGFINLSTTWLERNNPDSALAVLGRSLQYHSLNDYVHLKLAMTYYEAGRYDEAMLSCRESLRLNPNDPTAMRVYRELLRQDADSTR